MMNVLLVGPTGIRTARVRLVDRLMARYRAATLDAQLANGVEPEAGVLLALRARRLVSPSQAYMLAKALKWVVMTSEASPRVPVRAPVRRDAVRLARGELLTLADRLLEPGPLGAQGVARARLLLRDGTGPLYATGSGKDLGAELRAAAAVLGQLA
jgi:hypothetical protein